MNLKNKMITAAASFILGIAVMTGALITAAAAEPKISASMELAENTTVSFTLKGLPAAARLAVITMPNGDIIEKNIASLPDHNGGKLIRAEVPTRYFDGDVTLDIKDSMGRSVLDAPEVSSVKECCEQYIEDNKGSADHEKYIALAEALAEYGEAANTYFSGGNIAAPAIADYGKVADMKITGALPDGIRHESATLVLESKTKIRHYFELSQGTDINALTFYADLNENGIMDPDEELLPVQADGEGLRYTVEIGGIAPNDLDRVYKLVVLSDSDKYTCSYGVMTYAKRMSASSDNIKGVLTELLAKMQSYWIAANELRATVTLRNDDGALIGTLEYNYGVDTPIVINEAPESRKNPDYCFAGWYNGDAKTDTVGASARGDITLTANYRNNIIGEFTQSRLMGYNTSFKKESVSSGVKFTTDSYINNDKRLDAVTNYKSKFFDSVLACGVRSVSFTMGLQMVSGYSAAAPVTMRVDGQGGKVNLFYLDSDNIVYFGGKANRGRAEYAMLDLDETDSEGNYVMKELKINIDLSRIRKSGDTAVGIYTVSAVSEDGRRLSVQYEADNMNWRFAQMSLGGADAACTEGEAYGIIVDSPRFTYDANSVSYVLPEAAELREGFKELYSYGVSEALETPRMLKYTSNDFNGYFFDSHSFRGWYLDEECTVPIVSVPANSAGPLLIYSKWGIATETENEQKRLDETESFKKIISSFTEDMGVIPEFKSSNTATVFPNTDHPRLYVNESTLPTLKANLAAPESKANYDKLIERALWVLSTDGRLPAASGKDPTNYDVRYTSGIEALAFLYLVTDNEYFGYAAIAYALNFFDTVHFPVQIHGSSEEYEDSNKASGAFAMLCEVYDWCYYLLTPKNREQLLQGMCTKLAKYFEMGCPPELLGPITGHGVSTEALRDYLSLAIAVYDEHPEIYNYVLGKIEAEYVEAPEWYYPSGANFQGSAYGLNKSYCHMLSDILVYTMSGQHLYDGEELFRGVTETLIHQIRPDGEPIRMGDDYNQSSSTGDISKLGNVKYSTVNMARLAFFGASYYKIPSAKAWFRVWTDNYTRGIDWGSRCEMTPTVFLLLNDPEVSADDKYEGLELVHYNGSPTGAITVRSAWDDAKLDSTWMTFTTIDECYGANHDHKDAGTFQIYYKGMLALNSSDYSDYGSDMDLAYAKQTISKNGLLIYNPKYAKETGWVYSGGQTTQGSKNAENSSFRNWLDKGTATQARVLGYSCGYNGDEVRYAYISGDITNAYDADTVDLVMRSTMTLATNDPAHPMVFLVHDRIISDDASFKKTFLLHTTGEPVYDEQTNSFCYTNVKGVNGTESTLDDREKNNGRLTNTVLLPEAGNYTYEAIGGDGGRYLVNGKNFADDSEIWRYPVKEVGWGRVELSPKAESRDDSFLNVMYVGSADEENAQLIPSVPVITETHEGALTFGNCVMFSRSNEPLTDEVSFTVNAEGTLTYYVGGLDSGAWQISVNGAAVGSVRVKDGEGLAVFTAPAGDISITPAFAFINYEIEPGTSEGELPERYEYGEVLAIPQNISRIGYEFEGWYMTPDYSGEPVTEIAAHMQGSITLYAKWKKLFDVLVLDTNGGSTEHEPVIALPKREYVLPTDVVKDGFCFIGWYTSADFSAESRVTSVNGAQTSGDITVYACFEECIEYSVNKNTSNQINGKTFVDYADIIASDPSRALTLVFTPDKTDLTSERQGAIRVRTNTGKNAVYPIRLDGNNILDHNGERLSSYADGGRIEIVLDFDANELRYYINGKYERSIKNAGFDPELSNYDFTNAPTYKYLWQYNSGLKDSDFTLCILRGNMHGE